MLFVGTLSTTIFVLLCSTFLYLTPLHSGQAQNLTDVQNHTAQIHIPATISKEAQEELNKVTLDPQTFRSPDSDDIEGWKKQYLDSESFFIEFSKPIIELYQPNISETDLGGVQVLDIKSRNWIENGKVLVYTHGGAYTFGSANSTLASPVLAANATGLRIISVNYTVAPFSKWNQTTDEVLSVIRALKEEQGYSNDDIAMFGDSAGGGLAAGSVLKMRDLGLGLPAG